MADTTVDIVLKASGDAEEVLGGVTRKAVELQKEVEKLQALGDKKTLDEQNLYEFYTGLGLVNKTAQETQKILDDFSKSQFGKHVQEEQHEAAEGAKEHSEAADHAKESLNGLIEKVGELTGVAISLHAFWEVGIKGAAEFETSIARLNATASLAGADITGAQDNISQSARRFGESLEEVSDLMKQAYTGGAKDAAEATELVNNALGQAKLSGENASQVLQVLQPIMRQYGAEAKDAELYTAKLAATAAQVNLPMTFLGRALQFNIPIAKDLGVTFDDLQKGLISLSRDGVPARQTISLLGQVLNQLKQPGGEVNNIFRQNGFESAQAAIQAKGFAGALDILNKGIATADDSGSKLARNSRLSAAFASIAKGAKDSGDASEDGAEKIAKFREALEGVEQSGGEALKDLGHNTRNTFIQVGESLLNVLKPLILGLDAIVKKIGEFAESHKGITELIAGLLGVALAVKGISATAGIIATIAPAANAAAVATTGLATSTGILRTAFVALQASLAPLLVGLGALALGYYAGAKAIEKLNEASQKRADLKREEAKLGEAASNAGALGLDAKQATEISALNDEELRGYQRKLQALIPFLEAQNKATIASEGWTAKARQQVSRLGELKEALEITNSSVKALDDLQRGNIDTSAKLEVQYHLTKEAVKAWADQARDLQRVDFDRQSESLKNAEQDALQAVHEREDLQAKVVEEFSKKRIDLASQNAAKLETIAKQEADREQAVLDKAHANGILSDEKYAAATYRIDTKLAADLIKNAEAVEKAVEAERDKAAKAYEKYAAKVVSLDHEIRDLEAQGRESDLDLDRTLLDSKQRYYEETNEMATNSQRIKEALAAKDYDLASKLVARNKELAKNASKDFADSNKPGGDRDVFTPKPIPADVSDSYRRFLEGQNKAAKAAFDAAKADEEAYAKRQEIAQQKDLDAKAREDELALKKAQRDDAAKEADATKTQLQSLDGQLASIQKHVDSLKAVSIKLFDEENLRQADAISKRFTKDVKAGGTGGGGEEGGEPGYAGGGPVRGDGPEGVDSVHALLAPGEGVLTTKGMKALGADNLKRLNAGELPHFASGGMIGSLPSYAGGGVVGDIGGGGDTVHLHLPDGSSYPLSGQSDVVSQLRAALLAAGSKRSR